MNLQASWRNQLLPLRLMRLWLGATWIYAGWDKASDPGFLTSGSTTFIGSQLSSYAQTSPLGFLLDQILIYPTQVGLFVMISEFAIGFATLLWIAPTWAAFGGFSMSMGLWLFSSWSVQPYFLASNSAYAVLWLVYFLFLYGARSKRAIAFNRRGFILLSSIAALATGAAVLGKVFSRNGAVIDLGPQNIVKEAEFAIGANQTFTSKAGTPAVLFRTKSGVFAYSAVCTHQGCTVQFNSASKNLQCPCHGAVFDPFADAKAIAGPVDIPLPKIKVAISGTWIVES
jgi:Rieske Fe-S protein